MHERADLVLDMSRNTRALFAHQLFQHAGSLAQVSIECIFVEDLSVGHSCALVNTVRQSQSESHGRHPLKSNAPGRAVG